MLTTFADTPSLPLPSRELHFQARLPLGEPKAAPPALGTLP